jgi:hypothetical protein
MYAKEECPPCYVYIEFLSLGEENEKLLAKGIVPERFRLPGIKYKELADVEVQTPKHREINGMEVDKAVFEALEDDAEEDSIILFEENPDQDDFSQRSIQRTLVVGDEATAEQPLEAQSWKSILPVNLKHKLI